MFQSDLYSLEHSYWGAGTWVNRMQPEYKETRQYEVASRYITKQNQIITQKIKKNNINDVNIKPDQKFQRV